MYIHSAPREPLPGTNTRGNINVEDDGSVISFTRPDFGDEENGELQFTLSVDDGSEASLFDTLTVKFGKPSKPITNAEISQLLKKPVFSFQAHRDSLLPNRENN